MRALSQTLSELIVIAEDVVTRRGMSHFLSAGGDHFARLAAEVRRAEALPAENIRTTRAAMIMVLALEEFRNSNHEAGSPWLMLAGATLPLLRAEAWVATRQDKEARGQ